MLFNIKPKYGSLVINQSDNNNDNNNNSNNSNDILIRDNNMNEVIVNGNVKKMLKKTILPYSDYYYAYSFYPLLPNGIYFNKNDMTICGIPKDTCENKKCDFIISDPYNNNSTVRIVHFIFNISDDKKRESIGDLLAQDPNKRKADDNSSVTSYTNKKRRLSTNMNNLNKHISNFEKKRSLL